MRRIAIIDMGTNTFHLLIAEIRGEGRPVIIHRDLEAVKIGMAGINEGRIAADACARALKTMLRFHETITGYHVSEVFAFGTSAFRSAGNASALVSEIKSATGISVQVITGDEEAEYIFLGARAAVSMGPDQDLVMDIGAGSVEFIIGDRENIRWKQSFEIGGQRLLEKFHKHDPILPQEISMLNAYLDESLKPLLSAMQEFHPAAMIGVSGTFDTLSEIYMRREAVSIHQGATETPLTREVFFEIHEELIRKNREERMQMEGMIAMRVDMIVATSCLIRWVLEKHLFNAIRVSRWSLKEGVLAWLAEGRKLPGAVS